MVVVGESPCSNASIYTGSIPPSRRNLGFALCAFRAVQSPTEHHYLILTCDV